MATVQLFNPKAGDTQGEGELCRSFSPQQPGKVWMVQSGKVDLFLQESRAGAPPGARSHVLRIEKNQALFGLNASRQPGVVLVASLHPGTVLSCMDLQELRGPEPVPQNSETVRLINEWVHKLYFASSSTMPPREFKGIKAGVRLSAEEEAIAVVPDEEIVWVRQLTGNSRFLGTTVEVSAGAYLPVSKTSRGWLQVADHCCVAGVDFRVVQLKDPEWKWLDDFHDLVLSSLLDNMGSREREKRERLKKQKDTDAALVHRTLAGLAAPLLGEQTGSGSEKSIGRDLLLLACREIGGRIGVNFRSVGEGGAGVAEKHAVEAIAKASNVRYRRVLLRPGWWKQDCGPLLAFHRENNRPVALLPKGQTSYEMHDPLTDARTRVSEECAAGLLSFAYSFYPPLPAKKLGGRDLLLFGFKATKHELFLICCLGLAGGLLSMVLPVVTGIIFDHVIPGAERLQLYQLTTLLLASAVATALFTLVRSLAVLRLEARIDATAQAAMWDRVLRLPVPFFRDYSSGDLAVRSLAITLIRQILTNSTLSSILSGIFSIFSFVLLFYYSWVLALLATGLIFIALIFSLGCAYAQLRYIRRIAPIRGKISSMLLQFINGITKLRVSGTENRVFAAWALTFAEQKRLYLHIRKITNRLVVFNSVFPVLALATLFWFASPLVGGAGGASLSTGAFLAFLAAFVQFLVCALQLTSSLVSILGIVPIYERALPILQTLPEVDEAKSDPGDLKGGIEARHLSFRYDAGSPMVLRDVTFTIAPGEFVAFTGPSGSGKSTLLRLLLGFEQPESGMISYDGQDIAGIDIQAVRRQIGVVLQSGRLISGTIYENIVGSLPLTHDHAWEAANLAGVSRDIKAMPMGMHTFVSDGGGGFSGGQRQRLMIARAVVNKPRILFFDEATSALDNHTQAIVSKSLESLNATRIVIAHRLSTIMNADRIFVFDKGAIVQSGKYHELLDQPGLFRELVQRQVV